MRMSDVAETLRTVWDLKDRTKKVSNCGGCRESLQSLCLENCKVETKSVCAARADAVLMRNKASSLALVS